MKVSYCRGIFIILIICRRDATKLEASTFFTPPFFFFFAMDDSWKWLFLLGRVREEDGGSTLATDLLKHARFWDEVQLTINHSNGRRGSRAFDGLAKALDLTALSNLLSERGAMHSGQRTGNQAEPRAGSPSHPELITSAHGENNTKSLTFLIQQWRCTETLWVHHHRSAQIEVVSNVFWKKKKKENRCCLLQNLLLWVHEIWNNIMLLKPTEETFLRH